MFLVLGDNFININEVRNILKSSNDYGNHYIKIQFSDSTYIAYKVSKHEIVVDLAYSYIIDKISSSLHNNANVCAIDECDMSRFINSQLKKYGYDIQWV